MCSLKTVSLMFELIINCGITYTSTRLV